MKAVAFDLGDTLTEYEGFPLSWEAHYSEALYSLASFLDVTAASDRIAAACAVLRRYNTRVYPRSEEVTFATILAEIQQCFDYHGQCEELACAAAFFRIFRQRLRCFPETPTALKSLRQRGMSIGLFTDVPYGMPREFVLQDLNETGLREAYDTLLTSRDVGHRKPSPLTLARLAESLSCEPNELAYVGNEKKDVDVARAFGCSSILIDRERNGMDWGQDRTITALTQI